VADKRPSVAGTDHPASSPSATPALVVRL